MLAGVAGPLPQALAFSVYRRVDLRLVVVLRVVHLVAVEVAAAGALRHGHGLAEVLPVGDEVGLGVDAVCE